MRVQGHYRVVRSTAAPLLSPLPSSLLSLPPSRHHFHTVSSRFPPALASPPLFLCHILPLLIVECLPNQSDCSSTLIPSFPTHPPSISANIPPTPSVFACSEKLHFFALSHRANYLCCRGTRVKPSARVIAHGVGMRSMHLVRASPGYGRW